MGTVVKALTLLTLFTRARPLIGLSDVARLSGLNKATAFRHLEALRQMGFVEQVGDARAYRLGSEVLRLAALREAAVPLLSVARGILEDLSRATGETAHMSHVQQDKLISLGFAYGAGHGTQVRMEDADVLSFHATSSGLAVLGFSAHGFVDAALTAPLKTYTSDTQTDPGHIRQALDQVRATGMAETTGGFETDVHSLAVPIFGPDRMAIGALAVAAPVARMNAPLRALIRAELHSSALALTQQTGGLYPPGFPFPDTT